MEIITLVLVGLCWGSFLNVVAFRIVYDKPFLAMRSRCPFCAQIIAWYDLVPVFSWFALRGRCRWCRASISWLYPLIEITTALIFVITAWRFEGATWLFLALIYFLQSLLIVAVRADLEAMVVPRICTIPPLLIFLTAAFFGVAGMPSLFVSLGGALLGFGVLWLVDAGAQLILKTPGVGAGDMELAAAIGAFTGPVGLWSIIILASIIGSLVGGIVLISTKKSLRTRLPFVPFLALAAILYIWGFDVVSILPGLFDSP